MLAGFLLINHLVVSQIVSKPLLIDSSIYLIRTITGKEFIGKIIDNNDSSFTIQIENDAGESFATIPKKEVKEKQIVHATDIAHGQYWGTIPNVSYVLSPSGYSLRKGQWYFQNIWIIYNQLNYGVTDHIQVGLGGFVPNGMLWGNVRITLPVVSNRLIVGGAINYSTFSNTGFWINEPKFLIAYGFATIGSPHANFSIGYGRVYNRENNSQPLYVVSGALRASKAVLLVTENYLSNNINDQMHLFGIRTGRKSLTFTVGVSLTKANRFNALPWIGFGIRFW